MAEIEYLDDCVQSLKYTAVNDGIYNFSRLYSQFYGNTKFENIQNFSSHILENQGTINVGAALLSELNRNGSTS